MSSYHSDFKGLFGAALIGGSLLMLSACQEGGLTLPGFDRPASSETAAPQSQSVQLVERDVEAPDVFQKTDRGLWDGRPSLGGVWVAHPGVSDPERVIIRNQDNGSFVIGALFRKEVATPGPKFQVSSDAARALKMLAGAPATLNVTALRREEPPQPPADAPVDGSAAPEVNSTPLPAPKPGATAPKPKTPVAKPTSSPLAKPYVQLGIFSVKANADRTAARLRSSNVVATVTQSSSAGKTFYRVLIGPAQTSAARAELLAKAKGQGFADAYFVSK